jgi:ABC-type lipoprotein export system ATPase subunit
MIRLEHVHRVFQVGEQKVHALNDLMLHIGRGEYLSIMGPSGSGKSTLLNILGILDRFTSGRYILGILDRFTSGRYLLDGTDVTSLTDDQQARTRREKIGFVFQFFHLVPRLTAEQNTARKSSPGASVRGSPLRALPLWNLPCCSPTSLPAISIALPAKRSLRSWSI